MDKKDLIIQTYEKLLQKESKADISISNIAKEANIAKGGIYYYFSSKEEILDAVIEKNYLKRIENAVESLDDELDMREKLINLFRNYMKDRSTDYLDSALHTKANAYMHQKSLTFIVCKFSEIISDILYEGIKIGQVKNISSKKEAYNISMILMGTLTFLLDTNLFPDLNMEKIKIAEIAFSNFSNNIGLDKNIFYEVIKNED